MCGPVHADAEAAIHHAKHGDGIVDIALEVPDVDKAYTYALSQGATGLVEPHDEERRQRCRPRREHRHLRRHPAHL